MSDHAAEKTSQTKYPWRATLRTGVAFIVGLAASWALVIQAAGVDPGLEWVSVSVAAAAGVTRVMAVPFINEWLTKLGLGAEPKKVG
jgi:hypothetical protein